MASLSLKDHGEHAIRVINPGVFPYRPESARDKAWRVVRFMDGLTVEAAHNILKALEPNIQGQVGHPLGWIADAIDRGDVKIKAPV